MTLSRRDFLRTSAFTVAAAGSGLIPRSLAYSAPAGDTQRLAAGWEFLQGPLGGVWEALHSEGIAVWLPVTVPHCFNRYDACDPDTAYYRGEGWYRTKLVLNNPHADGRTLLHFEGAGQRSDVYVGQTLVGQNIGGYNEFLIDITDAAAPLGATVPLIVRCDNSRSMDTMPADVSDFSLYGGLYRNVSLIYVPAVALASVHVAVDFKPGESAHVAVRMALHNPASHTENLSIRVEIVDPNTARVHRETIETSPWVDRKEITHLEIERPQLWSTDDPKMYECRVSIESKFGQSSLTQRFGIRHAAFDEQGVFRLNGKKLFLKGTQRHEDDAHEAAAVPEAITRREIEMIAEMGANFVRLAHYQQSELVLDLCDEKGVLVWEEVPWCRGGVGNDSFKQMGRRLLRTMIEQHYNHPSIVFWGLGNEDDWPGEYPSIDKQAIRAYMQELNNIAHQLDPSRLTSFRRSDFAGDIPDAYSPSIWAGWYRGAYTEYQQMLEEQRGKVKHLLHIEWGADAHARRHAEDPYLPLRKQGTQEQGYMAMRAGGSTHAATEGDWSETYACDLFDWHLKVQETLSWFSGSAQWAFKDFSTPLRPENPVPRVNQKGLVERDLTKKEGYYVFQSYWAEAPMAHIYGHSWPVRWGEPRWVKVYSNCDSAELFLNGKSCGVKKRNTQDFPAAGLRWECNFLAGENLLHVVARKGSATVTDEIRFQYQAEKWSTPAVLKLSEISREDRVVTVEAKVVDGNGVQCLDARNRIRFSIAGDGVLIDNLGTSAGSRVVEMYNGRAMISARQKNGPITIGVTGDQLASALLTIS